MHISSYQKRFRIALPMHKKLNPTQREYSWRKSIICTIYSLLILPCIYSYMYIYTSSPAELVMGMRIVNKWNISYKLVNNTCWSFEKYNPMKVETCIPWKCIEREKRGLISCNHCFDHSGFQFPSFVRDTLLFLFWFTCQHFKLTCGAKCMQTYAFIVIVYHVKD